MNESLQIKDATIIVQSTNMTAPHLETELEIIECLLSQNNSVYWLQCNIEMKNCFYNPENNYFRCLNCKSKVKNSEKILKFHNLDIRFLDQKYKGLDFTGKDLPIPIKWVPRRHNYSTTKLIKSIKKI